ncbi:MAG: hypothetical protein ACR2JM_16290, partial [Mycobacterium sp.]
ISTVDAGALLEKFWNVTAELKTYGTENAEGTLSSTEQDGQNALSDLQAALAKNGAATAVVNAETIWNAARPPDSPPAATPNYADPNHAVSVVKVDLNSGMVYLNDSGPAYGQGERVPLGAFMSAWQGSGYKLTIVKKKEDASGA